jgi:ribitol-5-phosphate 2-dehydrogenase (NADP+)
MAEKIRYIAESAPKKSVPPVDTICYRIVGPWQLEAKAEKITEVPEGCALVRTRYAGICHADLRYISCSRPPEVLRERLPMAPFHEGMGDVMEVGPGVTKLRIGQRVCMVPNLPCYVHDPWKYPSVEQACVACRPGGAGENYCTDVRFLASNTDGMARSVIVHPVAVLAPVPDGTPDDLAALAEPLSVVYAGIEPMAPRPMDRIAVLGTGVIGYLTALMLSQVWRIPRERILCSDIFDDRLGSVNDFAQTINSRPANALDKLEGQFDTVFECAGGKASQVTIEQAIKLMKPGGHCMLMGVSEEPVPVRTRRMLDKGLSLRGTTRSAYRHFVPVLEHLAKPKMQVLVRRVVNKQVFEADSAESIIAASRIAANPEMPGKVLIRW